MESVVKKLS